MDKIISVSCIGLGNRGLGYLLLMHKMKDKYQINALCDMNKDRLDYAKNVLNVDGHNCFLNENDFYQEKHGDLLVIGTEDHDHVEHAIKGLKLGYDILVEKPISNLESEVRRLLKAQQKYQRKVFVCHVLRYAPAFVKAKQLIDEGRIGRLVLIDDIEQVGYMHQAHSFVRGNWRSKEETSPMVIAKTCHDLDLFCWYIGDKCVSASSIGDLRYFKKENQPQGASDRCNNCKYRDICIFSCYNIYIKNQFWGRFAVSDVRPITDESVMKGLEKGPYGRCVFACDNNVVDNEMSIMHFANGINANLRMTAFTANGGRIMSFYGTNGEIVLNEEKGFIELKEFGKPIETFPISSLVSTEDGHGGGDAGIVKGVYDALVGNRTDGATLEDSVESHLIGFALEESRMRNGELIYINHEKEN